MSERPQSNLKTIVVYGVDKFHNISEKSVAIFQITIVRDYPSMTNTDSMMEKQLFRARILRQKLRLFDKYIIGYYKKGRKNYG